MKLRFFALVIFALVFARPVYSAKSDSIVNHIFKMIYNEQYSQAEIALAKPELQIDSFYADILKIDLYWWEFVKSREKEKSRKLHSIIDKFNSAETNSADGKIRLLIAKSYQIRYELKRYNVIGASLIRSDIKNLLDEIKKEKLYYAENRLELLDLYSSLFGYFDNLINPLFSQSKRNSRTNALASLEKYTADDDLVVQTLACYFLGKIYLNIENEPQKGTDCFTLLSNNFPKNDYFIELLTDCKSKS